jgi:hypothetical protein
MGDYSPRTQTIDTEILDTAWQGVEELALISLAEGRFTLRA